MGHRPAALGPPAADGRVERRDPRGAGSPLSRHEPAGAPAHDPRPARRAPAPARRGGPGPRGLKPSAPTGGGRRPREEDAALRSRTSIGGGEHGAPPYASQADTERSGTPGSVLF